MNGTYEDRVKSHRVESSPDLVCAIGSHEMQAIHLVDDTHIYTTVDGLPICNEHIMLITDQRTAAGIPEFAIKKILVRKGEVEQREKVQQRLRRTAAGSTPGWVYYARIGGLIKIGFTESLAQRIASYPPNTELLAAHPGTPTLEREMHLRFSELRSRGREWFRPATVLEQHIQNVREQFGDPAGAVRPMRHVNTGK